MSSTNRLSVNGVRLSFESRNGGTVQMPPSPRTKSQPKDTTFQTYREERSSGDQLSVQVRVFRIHQMLRRHRTSTGPRTFYAGEHRRPHTYHTGDKGTSLMGVRMDFGRSQTTVEREHYKISRCSLCLCKHYSEDVYDRGNIVGRHQQCVCECYCHIKASERSLVHMAAKSGSIKILEHLLRMTKKVDLLDSCGNTPLHLASMHGHAATANLLLQRRADPNKVDKDGNSALHYAAKHGHVVISVELQRYGGDVNIGNNEMRTPLHLAVMSRNHPIAKSLLASSVMDVNRKDRDGNTALHLAVQYYDSSNSLLLIRDQRTDINAMNNAGQTPLHLAAEFQRDLIVKQLLNTDRLKANILDNNGNTALHLAVKYGNLDVIKELLCNTFLSSQETVLSQRVLPHHQRIDLEVQNLLGLTPLHMAIAGEHVAISNYLLDKGSNFMACDADGNSCLHFAVAAGSIAITKKLLSLGMDVNGTNHMGDSCLHVAAYFRHVKMVEYLLAMGANVNCVNSSLSSPLHQAVESDSEATAMHLLKSGASINARDINGRTPIHLALINRNEALAVKLLTACKDFDLDAFDRKGDTLLHLTCKLGLLKVAKVILKLKPDLLNTLNVYGNSPLHYSCKYRQHKLTRLLLSMAKQRVQLEEFINQKNIAGKTALHLASKYGDLISSKLLLDHGAAVTSTDNKGQTPLHMASLSSHKDSTMEISRLLVDHGAEVDKADDTGETPLHEAAKSGNTDMVSFLLANGANIDLANKNEHTPFHLAAAYGKEQSMTVLISEGADYLKATSKGNTSIHGTAASGNVRALSLLVEQGVSPSTKNQDGMSSLHVAAANDQDIIIDYLVEMGVDITEQDNSGRTPLHIACSSGNQRAIEALLQYGADVNQLDNNGLSALDYAQLKGNHEIADALRARGGKSWTKTVEESLDKTVDITKILPMDTNELLLAKPLNLTVSGAEVPTEQSRPAAADTLPDDLRSDCTEDDIADQLGLFVQPLATPGQKAHGSLKKALSSSLLAKMKKSRKGATDDESEEMEKATANAAASRKNVTVMKSRKTRMKRVKAPAGKQKPGSDADEDGLVETMISQLSPSPSVGEYIPDSPTTFPSISSEGHRSPPMVDVRAKPATPIVSQSFPTIATAPAPGPVDLSRNYAAQKRKKAANNNRRAGNLLANQPPAPHVTISKRAGKSWLFDDDDLSTEGLNNPETEPQEREMSFDIVTRSPTPKLLMDENGNPIDEEEFDDGLPGKSKGLSAYEKRQWGKAKVDNKFRDELERQRLAEERKRKAMKMKLARAQHKNIKHDTLSRDGREGNYEEDDWLSQYCIFHKGALDMYTEVFDTLLGSTGEFPAGTVKLSLTEMLMALSSINRELQTDEGHYLIRICELLGCDIRHGCDLRNFSVVAALSHRITLLDSFTRRIYRRVDMQTMEMNAHFCKELWESCRDTDTNLMSKDKLIIELKAGGISQEHEDFVRQALTKSNKKLDFLDFLTYIPLFISIHQSVINNPLDDERSK